MIPCRCLGKHLQLTCEGRTNCTACTKCCHYKAVRPGPGGLGDNFRTSTMHVRATISARGNVIEQHSNQKTPKKQHPTDPGRQKDGDRQGARSSRGPVVRQRRSCGVCRGAGGGGLFVQTHKKALQSSTVWACRPGRSIWCALGQQPSCWTWACVPPQRPDGLFRVPSYLP